MPSKGPEVSQPPAPAATAVAAAEPRARSLAEEGAALTIDFEPVVDDAAFEIDFDMSAADIDEILRADLPAIPTLTDPIEIAPGEDGTDASMRGARNDEMQHRLANLEGLAHAKVLEDISNSMAETLFGDFELEQLAATLAVASGTRAPARSEEAHDDRSDDDEPPSAKRLIG